MDTSTGARHAPQPDSTPDQVDGERNPESTLTFLFADLEDSTPLVQQLGDAYPTLLSLYHSIVNTAITDHNGQIVSTEGDGFFCVFSSPVDAVEAAHEIQIRIGSQSWPGSVSPRCRIGIHTGTATKTLEGYVGLDVHRAARIGAAANGGQILISTATGTLVEDYAGRNGWHIVDVGAFSLKGINRSERLSRLDAPDLPVALLPPRAQPHIPSSIPVPARPIVGRVSDVQSAAQMIMRSSVRLVTITGPGGTGKTRLAIELARRLEPEFPDGVVFVDVSALRASEEFLPAVGRAFGVQESSARSIVAGLKTVMGAARILLILDNMEQLIAAGPEIGQILEAVPNLRVVVTSRSPLRLTWENEYPLLPLPIPTTDDAEIIRGSDAVRLFVDRAQAVRPEFRLTPQSETIVAEITRRLDGLPLAIELAAARLRVFSPQELLARLDDRLALLDRGAVDSPQRHQTLRAAIQWSHDLLDEPEKVLFRRLAVFSGGWPLPAVLAVCLDETLDEATAFDALEELVAKSVVVFSIDDQGQPRYRMLETLREYSLEKLRESAEENRFRRHHLTWCLSLTCRFEDALATPEFPALLEEVEVERFNLREALGWSLRTRSELDDALWICGLLALYWDTRGYVTEGLNWTGQLVALAGDREPSPGRALALGTIGWLAMLAGDPERSEKAQVGSDEMWRSLGDQKWLARSLAMHGMTTYNLNELDRAELQFNEAVALARRIGSLWLADAWCVYGLAHIALARNDFMSADRMLRATLDFSKSRGLTWGIGHAQLSLGVLAFMTGDIPQAVERLTESLLVRQQLKDTRGICDCLGMMAIVASVQGDHTVAATLLGAAEVRREATGQIAVPWQRPMLEQAAVSAQQALDEEFQRRMAEGRVFSSEEAIQFAIERLSALGVHQVEVVGNSQVPA